VGQLKPKGRKRFPTHLFPI